MKKQLETFSFSPPINLAEEGKWLLAVTPFEATNSVFDMNHENNSFSISTQGHWSSRGDAETNNELRELLRLREQNDIDLHSEEVGKIGNQIKIGDKEYKLSDLDTRKNAIIKELKNVEYNDLEDLVFRLKLTCREVENMLDVKYIDVKSTGYTIPSRIYEIIDINSMLKSIIPHGVEVNFVIDDLRLRSILCTNKTIGFSKKDFFLYNIGFYSIHFRSFR